ISGSKSSRAALFSKPTSSSNSVANTEEGNLIDGALKQKTNKKIHTTIYASNRKLHLCPLWVLIHSI
uniref:Uncharacterized protein n=1 Tax=Cairina moschata TaxID=8855 RepID=A0A8C3CDZ3_CAIMO